MSDDEGKDDQSLLAQWRDQMDGKSSGENSNVFVMWSSGLTSFPDATLRTNMLLVLDLR
jgi:hypothetical protein